MLDQQVVDIVSNVGFPIVIALVLLVRFEKKLSDIQKTLVEIAVILRDKK